MDGVLVAAAYAPGRLLCVLGERCMVVADVPLEDPGVPVVRDLALSGAAVAQLLQALTQNRAWGELPSLALVQLADPAVAVVRGDLTVVVRAPDGDHRLDGRGVVTWVEAPLSGGRVEVGEGAAAANSPLLLQRGVALVSGVVLPVPRGSEAEAADTGSERARHLSQPVVPDAVLPDPDPREHEPLGIVPPARTPPALAPRPRIDLERALSQGDHALPDAVNMAEPGDVLPAPPASLASVFPRALADNGGDTVFRDELPHAAAARAARPARPPAVAKRPGVVLHLSTGERIPVDGPLVLGREPRPPRLVRGEPALLVTVPSPGGEISRYHLEVCRTAARCSSPTSTPSMGRPCNDPAEPSARRCPLGQPCRCLPARSSTWPTRRPSSSRPRRESPRRRADTRSGHPRLRVPAVAGQRRFG